MASSVNWLTLPQPATAGSSEVSTAAKTTSDQTVSKETFLKLLVAQIRNQNPLSPADGIQFLSQLAQFTELEQMISMRQDLEAIRKSMDASQTSGTTADETNSSAGV